MRSFHSRRARTLIAITSVIVVLATSSCGRFARRSNAPASPPPTVGYGDGTSFKPIERPTLGTEGTLVVRVLDDLNRPILGAVVRFKGPETTTGVTDARGIVQRDLRAGGYEINLAPCGAAVVMLDQREATAFVVPGKRGMGQLIGARWERRFQPSESVHYSSDPPWKIGQNVDAFVRVEDRCNYGLARNAPLTGYGWTSSSHYGFTARPVMRSNGDGFARASIRCLKEGDGHVTIYDPSNEEAKINVLLAGPGPGSGRRFCER